MARYIDADNFRKTMIKRFGGVPCLTDYSTNPINDIHIDDALNLAPTADVVRVVRCKDCVWWYPRTFGSSIGRCENPTNGLDTEYLEDFNFCSYAKAKGGE